MGSCIFDHLRSVLLVSPSVRWRLWWRSRSRRLLRKPYVDNEGDEATLSPFFVYIPELRRRDEHHIHSYEWIVLAINVTM